MDAQAHSDAASERGADNVTEIHNPSVDESAARHGACAQVHLATGAMCVMRRGHAGSCEFTPAAETAALLATRRSEEHWQD
ncbi:hypothetical protein GCM10009858_19900 [Terrabacter carboxydivorans]|uniref:Uncharacterized protein n=1 Tax=Terrabacter carboxydivorans TaxID=619730 RepID=A0ABN3LGI2_9MICO